MLIYVVMFGCIITGSLCSTVLLLSCMAACYDSCSLLIIWKIKVLLLLLLELLWRFGLVAARWSRSTKLLYATGLVSSGMGDHVRGSTPGAGNLSQYITSHPGQLSLAIPLQIDSTSTSQRAVMPCGWGVKAGMVCVWVAGKTV